MGINLHQGDCLEVMAEFPDNSVDLICCDPPYGTTQCKWDTPIDLELLWGHYERVAKESAAILLFAQTPFDKVLGCSNLPLLKYELVWEKTHATGHLNAKKMPMKAHENILVFYRKLPTYNPQKTTGHQRKTSTKRNSATEVYGKQEFDELHYDSTDRYPRSVLTFSSDKQLSALHPTQKPVPLLEWLIATYSNPSDVVLDNCMGSGTTGVAAKKLGRKFIGIEKDPTYFQIASKRIGEAVWASN